MTAPWQVYSFLLYETIDFILPWVCFAVTEHRRFQNVERSRSVIFQIYRYDHMFYVICDLLLDRRTETQNRYVTFTITCSKTGSQNIFFSKTLFTSLFLLHCLLPLSNRRHRDQVGSIILPKDSDLSLSEREKGEKNLVPDHAGFNWFFTFEWHLNRVVNHQYRGLLVGWTRIQGVGLGRCGCFLKIIPLSTLRCHYN